MNDTWMESSIPYRCFFDSGFSKNCNHLAHQNDWQSTWVQKHELQNGDFSSHPENHRLVTWYSLQFLISVNKLMFLHDLTTKSVLCII